MHQKATRALARADERLRHAIATVGPCTMAPSGVAPYEALLSAICHQQLHRNAAQAILGRFSLLYATTPGTGRFPTPAELLATPEAALRGAGLSRSKILSFRSLAEYTADGTVPALETAALLEDQAVIERLTVVRGVGRWTAQMFLMFSLGRPDVLPVDDFGIREGFKLLYGKRRQPKPRWLEDYGARWAPHRTVAAWYLWRYVEHARQQKASADPAPRRRPKAVRRR